MGIICQASVWVVQQDLSLILISRHMQKYWLNYDGAKILVNPLINKSLIQMQELAQSQFKGLNKVEPSKLILQYDAQQIKTNSDYSRTLTVIKQRAAPEVVFKVKKSEEHQTDEDENENEEEDSERSVPNDDQEEEQEEQAAAKEDEEQEEQEEQEEEEEQQEQEDGGENFDSNEEVDGSQKDGDSENAHPANKKTTQKPAAQQASEEDSEKEGERDQEQSQAQQQAKPQDNDSQGSQREKPVDVQSKEEGSQDSQQSEEPQAIDNNSKPAEPKPQPDSDSEVEQPDEGGKQQLSESDDEQEKQDLEDKPQDINQESEEDNPGQDYESEYSSQLQSESNASQTPAAQVMPNSQDEQPYDGEEIEQQKQTSREETHQKPIEVPKGNVSVKTKAISKPKASQLPSNQLKMVNSENKQISAIKNPTRKSSSQKQPPSVDQKLIEKVNKNELLLIQMQKTMSLMQERLATLQREKESQPAQQIILTGCNGCGLLKSKVSRKKVGIKQLNIFFCDDCDSQFEITLKQK